MQIVSWQNVLQKISKKINCVGKYPFNLLYVSSLTMTFINYHVTGLANWTLLHINHTSSSHGKHENRMLRVVKHLCSNFLWVCPFAMCYLTPLPAKIPGARRYHRANSDTRGWQTSEYQFPPSITSSCVSWQVLSLPFPPLPIFFYSSVKPTCLCCEWSLDVPELFFLLLICGSEINTLIKIW